MSQFSKSTTVRLKSGGPVMTVGGEINGKLECHWFNNTSTEYTHKSELFDPELLKSEPVH
jgi:uncharacterized protein YodC (DUF2158 family)